MQDPSPGNDREALERLRGDEVELERRLAAARRDAADAVASARGEAERIAADARTGLEQELAAMRAEGARAVEEEAARGSTATAADVADFAERAARRRPEALARILALVLGRAG